MKIPYYNILTLGWMALSSGQVIAQSKADAAQEPPNMVSSPQQREFGQA
jgi:hypothetical protein